jgi:hypothetical protein
MDGGMLKTQSGFLQKPASGTGLTADAFSKPGFQADAGMTT